MKFKKIPDEKSSWSRVIAMLDIVLPIFLFLLSFYCICCFLPEWSLYSVEYPYLSEFSFSFGGLFSFFTFLFISGPESIHNGLKILKEDKFSEKEPLEKDGEK